MNNRNTVILIFFLLSFQRLAGQDTNYGPGYQTIMMTNPAFAGSESDGKLRLVYLNFYPGQNYNLHSFFASWDSYVPIIHGGAAAFISNDYLGGVINDLLGGFSYSYHLQANRNFFINAGLSASFFHRGFVPGNMIFPDQIDPLGGVVSQTSENMNIASRTVFDAGAGFVMMSGRFTCGLAINHLTAPTLSEGGTAEQKLDRELTVNISGLFKAGKAKKLFIRPLGYGYLQGDRYIAGVGSTVETDLISINTILLTNKSGDLDMQAGFFISRGIVTIFYNYCFNISSGNSLLPASLVHNTGIILSLKNVEKRKAVKTINFPKS